MKALWLARRYALKAHCSICLYTISQHLALLSSPSSHEAKCDTNASLSLMVVCEASEVSIINRRRLWHSAYFWSYFIHINPFPSQHVFFPEGSQDYPGPSCSMTLTWFKKNTSQMTAVKFLSTGT